MPSQRQQQLAPETLKSLRNGNWFTQSHRGFRFDSLRPTHLQPWTGFKLREALFPGREGASYSFQFLKILSAVSAGREVTLGLLLLLFGKITAGQQANVLPITAAGLE